jgi:hypothetical protein
MTAKELWQLCHEDDNLTPVFREVDDDWRHGSTINAVYEIDGKFWNIGYRCTPDNEENYWRDGYCEDPWEVWPVEVKTIVYTSERPNEE